MAINSVRAVKKVNDDAFRIFLPDLLKSGDFDFFKLGGGRRRLEAHRNNYTIKDNAIWDLKVDVVVIIYTPDNFDRLRDTFEYNGIEMLLSEDTYEWTIAKLSEWEVMTKLES